MFPLVIILVFASWHDFRHRRIPNYLTYGGLVIVFVCAIHTDYLAFIGSIKDSIGKNSLIAEQVETVDALTFVNLEKCRRYKMPSVHNGSISKTVVGCIGLTIPLLLLNCCNGIGGGDVKLGACIGAFVGLEAGGSILFIGHVLAGVIALIFLAYGFVACRSTELGNLSTSEKRSIPLNSKGLPMACFYLTGTLFFVWGV